MKVFINPGHAPNGNPDPGAVNSNSGLRESDVAFVTSQMLGTYLIPAGVEIAGILQSDSLEEVCEAANASGADFFISIHCNASFPTTARGTETWYCSGSEAGEKMADCIQQQIVNALGTTDRGIKDAMPGRNGLYVLSNTDMPAVLVELAFISNDEDAELLDTQKHEFAKAIARGVTDYQQIRG